MSLDIIDTSEITIFFQCQNFTQLPWGLLDLCSYSLIILGMEQALSVQHLPTSSSCPTYPPMVGIAAGNTKTFDAHPFDVFKKILQFFDPVLNVNLSKKIPCLVQEAGIQINISQ